MPSRTLQTDPKYRRSDPVRSFDSMPLAEIETLIDREGGKYGAGIISGASLIAKGEALGHGMFVDSVFLSQVSDALNSSRGIKVRYTHPDMSGDGLATHIGRAFSGTVNGDSVAADIHFTKAGRNTPDGDLGGHVMDQAIETPEDFGMSIVFDFDADAEREFKQQYSVDGQFESPDPDNENNLPHVRLKSLRAADFVGDPAANPNGVFYGTLPQELDDALAYAIGVSESPATCRQLSDVSPERARGFVQRFLNSHGLKITEASEMTTELAKTEKPAEQAATVEQDVKSATAESQKNGTAGYDARPTFAEFKAAFPKNESFAKDAFCEGLTMQEAENKYRQLQEDENDKLRQRVEALEEKLSATKYCGGEESPIEGTTDSVTSKPKRKSPSEKLAALRAGRN